MFGEQAFESSSCLADVCKTTQELIPNLNCQFWLSERLYIGINLLCIN